jgi:hypothetical protein
MNCSKAKRRFDLSLIGFIGRPRDWIGRNRLFITKKTSKISYDWIYYTLCGDRGGGHDYPKILERNYRRWLFSSALCGSCDGFFEFVRETYFENDQFPDYLFNLGFVFLGD